MASALLPFAIKGSSLSNQQSVGRYSGAVRARLVSSAESASSQNIAADGESLRNAVLQGGSITFSNQGTIVLSAPIDVRTNVTIDGRNQTVLLDGAATNRIFHVFGGAELLLTNVVLQNGAHWARNDAGLDLLSGTNNLDLLTHPGFGGAVLNEGTLRVFGSTIRNCGAYGLPAVWTGLPMPGATNAFQSARGGAIDNERGTVIFQNVTISNCTAIAAGDGVFPTAGEGVGGAIFNAEGTLDLENVQFMNNVAGQKPVLIPINFSFATASVRGGAVYSKNGRNTLVRCYFAGNGVTNPMQYSSARNLSAGGAVGNEGGVMVVDRCAFERNTLQSPFTDGNSLREANGEGGALFNSGDLHVRNSGFVENSVQSGDQYTGDAYYVSENAALGGALFNGGTASVVNCTFYRNRAIAGTSKNSFIPPNGNFGSAPAYGGAIYSEGSMGVTNCTFAQNQLVSLDSLGVVNDPPYFKGGRKNGYSIFSETNGVALLKNSIFAGSLNETNVTGTIVDAGYNLSTDTASVWNQSTSRTNTDPKLGALGYYGGPTAILPLLAGSPAIDSAETLPDVSQDQRGRARPFGNASDIGAFESSPPYAVAGFINSQDELGPVQISIGGVAHDLGSTNHFELGGFEAGTYSVFPTATNFVFAPLGQQISLERDTLLDPFTAYRMNAFTFERFATNLQVTFAADSNAVYNLQGSTNLSAWSDVWTGTLSSQLLRIPESFTTNAVMFFRVEQN